MQEFCLLGPHLAEAESLTKGLVFSLQSCPMLTAHLESVRRVMCPCEQDDLTLCLSVTSDICHLLQDMQRTTYKHIGLLGWLGESSGDGHISFLSIY